MKILNLYAGIGGNRQKWSSLHDITAVENCSKIAKVYQDLFPNDRVIVADAHKYLKDYFYKFDFIWSSPPCGTHSLMSISGQNKIPRFADLNLYAEILFLKQYFKGKFVVENVVPYYKPLIRNDARFGRNLFWMNFGVEYFSAPELDNMINIDDPEVLKKFLGIYFTKKLYHNGNHSPAQVLRNAVHPLLGEHILKCSQLKTELYE